MSGLQIAVEVTSDLTTTKNGSTMQDCYIDLGGKYPEAVQRYCPDGAPLAPGRYIATKGRIENYRPVIDLRSLQPLPKG